MSAVLHHTRSTDAFIAREEVLQDGQVEFAKYCSLQEEKGISEPYSLDAAQIYIQGFSEWEKEVKREEAERIRIKKEQIESREGQSTRQKPCRNIKVKRELDDEQQQQPTQEVLTLRRSSRLAQVKKEKTPEDISANSNRKPLRSRKPRRKSKVIKKEHLESEIVFDEIPVHQRSKGIGRDREGPGSLDGLQRGETIHAEEHTLDEDSIPLSVNRSISSEVDGLQRSAEAAYLSTDAHCILEPCSPHGSLEYVDQESIFAEFMKRSGFDAPKSYLGLAWGTTLSTELVSKCFDDDCETDELDWDTNIASKDVSPRTTEIEVHDYDSGIASGEITPASLLSRQPGMPITELDGLLPARQIERDIGIDIDEDTQFVKVPIHGLPDSAIDVEVPGNCSTNATQALNETAVAKLCFTLNQEHWQQIQAKARDTKQRLENDAIDAGSERKEQRNGPVHIHGQSQDSFEIRRDAVLVESTGSALPSEYTSENPEKSMNDVDTNHLSCLLRVLSLQGELHPTQSSEQDLNACSDDDSALQSLDQVANNDSCKNEATGACHISRSHGTITKRRETRRHRLRSLHTKLFIDDRCFVSFDEAFAFCTSRWEEDTRRRKMKRARRLAKTEEQQ